MTTARRRCRSCSTCATCHRRWPGRGGPPEDPGGAAGRRGPRHRPVRRAGAEPGRGRQLRVDLQRAGRGAGAPGPARRPGVHPQAVAGHRGCLAVPAERPPGDGPAEQAAAVLPHPLLPLDPARDHALHRPAPGPAGRPRLPGHADAAVRRGTGPRVPGRQRARRGRRPTAGPDRNRSGFRTPTRRSGAGPDHSWAGPVPASSSG